MEKVELGKDKKVEGFYFKKNIKTIQHKAYNNPQTQNPQLLYYSIDLNIQAMTPFSISRPKYKEKHDWTDCANKPLRKNRLIK